MLFIGIPSAYYVIVPLINSLQCECIVANSNNKNQNNKQLMHIWVPCIWRSFVIFTFEGRFCPLFSYQWILIEQVECTITLTIN